METYERLKAEIELKILEERKKLEQQQIKIKNLLQEKIELELRLVVINQTLQTLIKGERVQ